MSRRPLRSAIGVQLNDPEADGTPMPMSGGLIDGKMVLLSTAATKPLNRGTWSKIDGGRIRQLGEASSDQGKTWNIVFEGIYVRRSNR